MRVKVLLRCSLHIMSTARQVIALLKSHIEGEEQQFLTVAMQVAAHEARQGHGKVAQEIRSLVDQAKERKSQFVDKKGGPIPLIQPKGDLLNLLSARYSDMRLADMILPDDLYKRLMRIVTEQANSNLLQEHNLTPRRKILLVGAPGTGKSMTAAAIAGELKLPLFTVLYESLFTKFMGETATQLKLVFDAMSSTRGVYFFDEFDAIGSQRASTNDVGEIRRVLNSCLQFLENDDSPSLIIAATNHPDLLDKALYRRFDDVISYDLPSSEVAKRLITSRLITFKLGWEIWDKVLVATEGLSQAEIIRSMTEVAKNAVLGSRKVITEDEVIAAILERKSMSLW
jgi:AAA+ superfamily predicted ATPase